MHGHYTFCLWLKLFWQSQGSPQSSGVQELCESRGGRPGLSVIMSLTVSVDVKQHWTMLRHWSQFVPNMSTDIRGHEALHHHQQGDLQRSLDNLFTCCVSRHGCCYVQPWPIALFHDFSLDCLPVCRPIAHKTGRPVQPIVQCNSIFNVLGQETCEKSHRQHNER